MNFIVRIVATAGLVAMAWTGPAHAQPAEQELRDADAVYDDGPFAQASFGVLRFAMPLDQGQETLKALPAAEKRKYNAWYDAPSKLLTRLTYFEPLDGRTVSQAADRIIARYGEPTEIRRETLRITMRYTTHIVFPSLHEELRNACAREAGRRASRSDLSAATSVTAFENRGAGPVKQVCPNQYARYLGTVRARHAPDVSIDINDAKGTIGWTAAYNWPSVRANYARKAGFSPPAMVRNEEAVTLHGEKGRRKQASREFDGIGAALGKAVGGLLKNLLGL